MFCNDFQICLVIEQDNKNVNVIMIVFLLEYGHLLLTHVLPNKLPL